MSCTNCTCSDDAKSAGTDTFIQTSPNPPHPPTSDSPAASEGTPEASAPSAASCGVSGIDPASLAPGTVVEVRDSYDVRRTVYIAKGGGWSNTLAGTAGHWPSYWRITRVFVEVKEPTPIAPEDVRVGMIVERRKGDAAYRDRVQRIDGGLIDGHPARPYVWMPGNANDGWSLWLIEDAPQVDEDAALVEVMAEAVWRSFVGPFSQWPDGPGSPSDSDEWRESSRAAIVAARAAGYRIEAAR